MSWVVRDAPVADASVFALYNHHSDLYAHAGRVNGAVTFPVPISQQLAAGLQSGPFASLLGAAGIRYIPMPHLALDKVLVAHCGWNCQCVKPEPIHRMLAMVHKASSIVQYMLSAMAHSQSCRCSAADSDPCMSMIFAQAAQCQIIIDTLLCLQSQS